MNRKRPAMSAVIAIATAAAPLAGAKADPAYIAFPPFWPLITIGAIIESATAPVRPFCSPCYYVPPCYCVPAASTYYPPPPGYSASGYYQPGYYPGR